VTANGLEAVASGQGAETKNPPHPLLDSLCTKERKFSAKSKEERCEGARSEKSASYGMVDGISREKEGLTWTTGIRWTEQQIGKFHRGEFAGEAGAEYFTN
jgi:hypothetical protein